MPAEMTPGTRLGPYTIEAQLGAGGMGVVYRAVDTRLSRKIAIKVSSAAYDARFRREGLAIAALNHPRICTLFDVGPNYLVMELLDGETLAARLGKGALPLPQILKYGAQVAEALAAAHAQGITHRDLKPGNIMLTRTGIKVLDFGLAAMDGPETALTRTGVIMGTPAYMAPEQQSGGKTDARTDLYALGLVLYEMATGKRLSASEVEPVTLPDLPEMLAWIVERCLARDPERRWQSASDVQAVLEQVAVRSPAANTSSARWRWLWPLVATAGVVALFSLWIGSRGEVQPTAAEPLHVSIGPPPDSSFRFARNGEGGFAVSPDGTMLAFVARTAGKAQLWVRRLDGNESLLPETEDAFMPFWSPDSRWIAFLTPGKVKKIEVSGGVPVALADVGVNYSGTWGSDDVILIARGGDGRGPLLRLTAAGGAPVDVPGTDGGRWPYFLPDGRQFIYVVGNTAPPEDMDLWVGSVDAAEKPRSIGKAGQRPMFSAGHVLSARLGALWAQPFDPERAQLTGSAFPLNEPLASRVHLGGILNDFAANARGMLVYPRRESALTELVWRDRTGKLLGTPGDPGDYYTPRISPDGHRIAFTRRDNQNSDIWTGSAETAATTFQRFTFDPAIDEHPVWSPDGATLTFSNDGTRPGNIYRKVVTGAGNAERLTTSPFEQQPLQWSSDGKLLLFTQIGRRMQTATAVTTSGSPIPDGSSEIMVRPADGGESLSYLGHSGGAVHAQFNPGTPRWIAYDYDDSGRREVYVQAFVPGRQASTSRWQVSRGGGTMPRWRADGKELFYLTLEGKMMSVAVSIDGPAFQSASAVFLFDGTPPQMRTPSYEYDVTPDGQRFLLIEPAQKPEVMPLTLVTNWLASAKRK